MHKKGRKKKCESRESACRRCGIGLEIDVSRRLLLCFHDYGPLTAAVLPPPPTPTLPSVSTSCQDSYLQRDGKTPSGLISGLVVSGTRTLVLHARAVSHTHTHTHTLSLSLCRYLSLPLSLTRMRTHKQALTFYAQLGTAVGLSFDN